MKIILMNLNQIKSNDQMCTLKNTGEMPKNARNTFNAYLIGIPV